MLVCEDRPYLWIATVVRIHRASSSSSSYSSLRFALLNHHSHKHSPTDILKQWRVSLNRDCVADPDALAPFATDYTDNAAAPKPVVKGVYAPKDNGIPFAVSDKSEGYVTTTQVHGQGGEIYGFNCLLSNM